MKTKAQSITENRRLRGERASMQQMEAANPQFSVWVEASAGTGKTKVLSDRVLRLLLDGVNPMRILCLTYTKAAAVEMSSRISERLSKWSVMSDSDLEDGLKKILPPEKHHSEALQKYKEVARTLFAVLLDTPGGIKIQTIHSFCQEILKRFPLEAGVTPYFDILDDADSTLALKQICSEIVDENIAVAPIVRENINYLTQQLKEKSFADVMKVITDKRHQIMEKMRVHGGLEGFKQDLASRLKVRPDDDVDKTIAMLMRNIDKSQRCEDVEALLHGKITDLKKAELLQQVLDSGCRPEDFYKYADIFLTEGKIRDKLATNDAQKFDENVVSRMQLEAERVLETLEKCQRIKLYKATAAVFTVAGALHEKYENFKRTHAKLDYEDLILLTGNLLSDPSVSAWVLYKLDGGLDHILLDEAQDTSPEQWKIVQYLSDEFFAGAGAGKNKRTVFAVGDRKQSIYSFQGADPTKFDIMARYFADKAQSDFKKINLDVSFRSTAAVLDTVNQLFADPEVADGVTAENETVHHLPYRIGEFGHVEIWPLIVPDKEDEKTTNTDVQLPPMEMKRKVSVRAKLAQKIAEQIKKMVNENTGGKKLHYRDFMVLVQRRRSFVTEFIRACKTAGVPISGADKLKLSEQIAVQDLISLGKFLLLPNDDLALAEVLKSPLFGLDDDDLLELCYGRKGALLWSKLCDHPKYAAVYAQLQELTTMLDFVRPYELYNHVLTKMNGRAKFVERMGLDVEDALDEFINLTINFERENVPSLQNFIVWMSKNEIEIKRETEQNDTDAVRIMTVHGSKGLQAPVVFLPDTVVCKTVNRSMNLLCDGDEAYFPLSRDYYDENCNMINKTENCRNMEEYRRLLYVALTRAEDQLFICGYGNKEEKSVKEQAWYKLCKHTLQEIAQEQAENLVFECADETGVATPQTEADDNDIYPVEDWVRRDVAAEDALAKPYTPSKSEEAEDEDSSSPLEEKGNYYRRGTIIHKLLQFLPQNKENAATIISEFLQKNAPDFSLYQQQQIAQEVLQLLGNKEFADLFGPCARNEVPIMGEVDGKIISAQLDKLVILPHKIMIVDYKTNRPAAKDMTDTPASYVKQLQVYARLVQKIYTDLPVESYILWTNEARLMRVF
ncbi:MAG: double-strand break repair helicase AddA [Alphaproteobacteria bacterium]|nr:double-strand break repair helicase AddA [Alphaproteobacteria bacterium]